MSVLSFHHISNDSLLQRAVTVFQETFQKDPELATYGPGRVNLIGEHTDYNDGFVLPLALPFRTIIVGSKSTLPSTRILSCNISSTDENFATFTIDELLAKGTPKWANYVKGTIYQYLSELPKYFSFDAVIISNVPIGSGLSSSASLEVATATFLEKLCNLTTVTGVQKALKCQKAEHTFADTPCGIMDQYISAMGKRDHLLLIDCRSTEYKLVALQPDNLDNELPVIVIANTNVKHTLSGSEYPERVAQCKEAVSAIKDKYPHVIALRDVTLVMLDEISDKISPIVKNRAGHSISEDTRTLSTVEAIARGDYKTVGENMLNSHISLRDQYEVSCKELDILVELAMEVPGVYGSRMTGGGFGGCTVTLVKKDNVEALKNYLQSKYKARTNLDCECYVAFPSDGAGVSDISDLLAKSSTARHNNSSILAWVVPVSVGILALGIIACIIKSNKASSVANLKK